MAIRINPSKIAITVWDGITFLHILEINIGSSMNIPIAMIEVAIAAVEAVFDWRAYLDENFPGWEKKEEQA